VLRQFVEKNPGVLIVLCTYETELSEWEENLVEQGALVVITIVEPPKSDIVFWQGNYANQNLQRLTSYVGLQYVAKRGIPYALKIRTDVFLGMREVVKYLVRLMDAYPLTSHDVNMMGRIVVSSHSTMSRPEVVDRFAPYHIRDHWYFGFTRDLLRFFDMSTESSWSGGAGIQCCSPESSLTIVWMKDLGIQVKDVRELLGKYFIVEDYYVVEQCRTRVTGGEERWVTNLAEYEKRRATYLIEHMKRVELPLLFTTHTEWLKYRHEHGR
jgi:hypothetical protein